MASQDSVRLWEEPVIIPTYPVPAPDLNPMFLEQRVYQGSSGKVYPCAITDRVSDVKVDQTYRAVHLENEYLRLMVLPELGGRIHAACDRTNGYDFIYRQSVIKPALVGLLGPWISGGIEFNWPQHHRPTTFLPVEFTLEEHRDGSKTVWLSEHEPMGRTKGMVGICLHPGKAYLEAKVQLYNRTPLPQTFLWWANVGVRVHDQYQVFFPPDVTCVADHAKRALSQFPVCRGFYYGVDYRPGVDLQWYRNIPVPTSYMAIGSSQDFFGGYDHRAQAGLVHVANHHVSPGKKLWTWGNHEFGRAWERELTDHDGPYVELMAGVYTDNQPDFSWLQPFETRSFRQYWYPIQKIGPAKHANLDAAVNLEVLGDEVKLGVSVSAVFLGAFVELEALGQTLLCQRVDLAPGAPYVAELKLPNGRHEHELVLQVRTSQGVELIRYCPQLRRESEPLPAPASEPALPSAIKTTEELYLTGLHLEQYRHATRAPELYWREALRREPEDARNHTVLGRWHLRRGEFTAAETCFRRAIATLTRRNPNPADGEPSYHLGLALRYQGRWEEAYSAFYKAAWSDAWQSACYYALAELDCRRGDWPRATEHLDRSYSVNTYHTKVWNLKAAIARKLGRDEELAAFTGLAVMLDPLDAWARPGGTDVQAGLDVAFDLGQAGFFEEALVRLARLGSQYPMVLYASAWFAEQAGDIRRAAEYYRQAARAPTDYCFPSRLEELQVLEAALCHDPRDARAHYYLGNLLYDKRRHAEAIRHWELSAKLDRSFAIVWRNLGLGYFNARRAPDKAKAAYRRACAANPKDARLLFEMDQLHKRLKEPPVSRLSRLECWPHLVAQRDDLALEFVTLLNHTGQNQRALDYLSNRRFHPWEGGEGLVLAQYARARLRLGQWALAAADAKSAGEHFAAALNPPPNLGETRHPLADPSDIYYWLGVASESQADATAARGWWTAATRCTGDFQDMSLKSFSETTYYRALCLRRLGREAEADGLLSDFLAYSNKLLASPAKIDYFATSLPDLLLFENDLQERQTVTATFLLAQANLGLGRTAEAKKLLKKVLHLDPSHGPASDLAEALGRA